MSIIDGLIAQSGFEKVVNRIGFILFTELAKQKTLGAFENDVEVFVDRLTPFDKSEDVVINIQLASNLFSGKTQRDSQGTATFFIDIYNNAKQKSLVTGSKRSSNINLRFLGLCRSILSSTKYNTLGFEVGLIGGTMCEEIQTANVYEKGPAEYDRFGRIVFTARIQENSEMWKSQLFNQSDTTIKLGLTDFGYQLIKEK